LVVVSESRERKTGSSPGRATRDSEYPFLYLRAWREFPERASGRERERERGRGQKWRDLRETAREMGSRLVGKKERERERERGALSATP